MYWSAKDLSDPSKSLVRFIDGRLYSILPDRSKKATYALGDEFGVIDGNPKHQGPLSEARLISILNGGGAEPVSLGDAMRMRADYRVHSKLKQAAG
jgi:hypothetical protein